MFIGVISILYTLDQEQYEETLVSKIHNYQSKSAVDQKFEILSY